MDGARLAYALASPANDVSLADLARLTDVFYIGGTARHALRRLCDPRARGSIRRHPYAQHGALRGEGAPWAQFEALFEDGLYLTIGKLRAARRPFVLPRGPARGL